MTPKERLFLIDGMALAYRAYFAFIGRPLVNSKGENTSAIFGFVNSVWKILDDEKPDHIAVVFDTPEPTFRHKKFKEYKATRQKMPEDMALQMDKLKEIVQAFNIPTIELPGYEADDVMGTLAKRAEKEGMETYLVSGDKDFLQLVSPLVKVYKPGRKGDETEIIDVEGVKERFGVEPSQVVDVLGLVGDKSDNVPGVPGVGEKTAIPLIQQFGSVEEVVRNAQNIPQQGLRKKIEDFGELALLSKELVTIHVDAPVDADIHQLKASTKNVSLLKKLFMELEFHSLLRKLRDAALEQKEEEDISFDVREFAPASDIDSDEHEYRTVDSMAELRKLVKRLKKADRLVFDTETTSTNPLQAELVGLAFSLHPREAYYVPIASSDRTEDWAESPHDLFSDDLSSRPGKNSSSSPRKKRGNAGDQASVGQQPYSALDRDLALDLLRPIFEDPKILKIGQNLKYDLLVLATHGLRTEGIEFDTMVASYVLRPDGRHNLDALAQEFLNYKMITYSQLVGSGRDRVDIRSVPLEKISRYSAQDADVTFRLYEVLKERLEREAMERLCKEVEFPLIAVLADMELAGVKLDVKFLESMSKEFDRIVENLSREIFGLAGEEFNINSTQQLSKILFEKLNLSIVRKTKTGISTDAGVLETLRNEHPVVDKLLEYRLISKLKSTYCDALPKIVSPKTGRIHTSFNQTVAATGRLSSSDPNLQNIPIKTELGREIRKAFVAGSKKGKILSADYSQVELRIMAHMSADEGLREAFLQGEDIHATTAAKVFGVDPRDVTREMRRKAKEVNFGIMYGIGAYGLSSRLEISQAEAKEIIQRYFQRFPSVSEYIENTLESARRDGYVSTLLGRRRYIPDIKSANANVRGNAERQAINMPIQGTAADMIKLAMVAFHTASKSRKLETRMVLQVHDELVFDVPDRELEVVKEIVVECMKNALPLSVPVVVDVGTGKNWFEAH
ncbi:MAG TPA: DNA polymerase I [Bacteroidota bacterium]